MAYKIVTERCVTAPWLCGDCRPGCPNKAISTAHVIDPESCTECWACTTRLIARRYAP